MREFEVVEVQVSFYRRITDKQINNWLKASPENFEFVLKAPQCATHPPNSPTYRRSHLSSEERKGCGFFRLTDVVKREMEDFLDKAIKLRTKSVLFQTPASFRPTDENLQNMERFFSYFAHPEITYFWEPRGKDWDEETVKELCKKLKILHATDPFLELPLAQQEPVYFRMHGDLRTYNYRYSEHELKRLKELVKGRNGYIFFNNVYMLDNAREFRELL